MAQSFNYPAVIVSAPLAGLDVNVHDAAGNPIGSTAGALDVNATLTDLTAGPTGAPVPAEAGYIAGKGQDGNLYGVNLDNSGNLFALPLPTGAATAALQTTGNAAIASILLDMTNGTQITQITGTIPLPTGAATEATLAALSAKFGSLGQKTMAGSAPVVIASDQTAIPVSGTVTANNASVGATGATIPASATYIGGLNGGNLKGLALDASGNLGALPLPTGAATETTLAALDTKVNANYGVATGAVRTASQIGNASGIADFGTGVKGAQTLRVVIATDQSAIPVSSGGNPTGNYAEITNLTTSAQTFTAPANAVGFLLEALSDNSANVRWKQGATATTTSGMRLEPGRDSGYIPCYANISVIAESGTNQVVTVQWVLSV